MHRQSTAFASLAPGDPIGPYRVVVSAEANARYWRAAGVSHPRLEAGTLYPPIAANLTILAFGERCSDPVIQTRQRLVCHRLAPAGTPLVVTGAVVDRYDKRGRPYVDVRAVVATADRPHDPVWTSEVAFTPTAAPAAGGAA